jgi:AGCS family alanine or glycine:cation symporter
MTTKFVEVTMAHKYRTTLSDGSISGGPMYYIEKGLNMKWVGVLFAALMMICAIGSGNMPQINNIANVLEATFSIPKLLTGLVLGIMLWVIIVGGIKRIAQIASKLVPLMGVIYFGGALIVLIENYQNIIPSFNAIFSQVFTGSAAVGGFLGASFAMSLKLGVARGLYSNEAGQGSSPIAHASAKTEKSVEQGMVSILEPFIDTIVVCSVTALVILSSGAWTQKYENSFDRTSMFIFEGSYSEENADDVDELGKFILDRRNFTSNTSSVKNYSGTLSLVDGVIQDDEITIFHKQSIGEDVKFYQAGNLFSGKLIVSNGSLDDVSIKVKGKSLIHSAELTAKAFSSGVLGNIGEYIVAIGLLLFAFSTAIAWSYYGDRSTAYIFGEGGVRWYRMIYVFSFILAAVIDTEIIWNIAYVVVALVSIPNLIALFVLRKEMKDQVNNYVIEK